MLDAVATYYSGRLNEFGETPRGVDWNGEASQTTRFEQITKIIDQPNGFSIIDLGCGYGGLIDYLEPRFKDFRYTGVDVSEHMIASAKNRAREKPWAGFECGSAPSEPADFCVASGIFSVKLDAPEPQWSKHFYDTLQMMDRFSRRGFAFNSLTSYSDADKMRNDLFYPSPLEVFDFCKRNYSRQVALLHDYGLWEFTILVRKA